jgi:hypothetical protein
MQHTVRMNLSPLAAPVSEPYTAWWVRMMHAPICVDAEC